MWKRIYNSESWLNSALVGFPRALCSLVWNPEGNALTELDTREMIFKFATSDADWRPWKLPYFWFHSGKYAFINDHIIPCKWRPFFHGFLERYRGVIYKHNFSTILKHCLKHTLKPNKACWERRRSTKTTWLYITKALPTKWNSDWSKHETITKL